MFPLKPFLHLCINSPPSLEQSAFTYENEGVKALLSLLGPISLDPSCSSYPKIPRCLENWHCRELAQILGTKEEVIFWTILDLHNDSKIEVDQNPIV